MRVRADQHAITDRERAVGPSAQDGVLHHEHVLAEDDRSVVAVQDRAGQDPCARAKGDVSGDDRARSD